MQDVTWLSGWRSGSRQVRLILQHTLMKTDNKQYQDFKEAYGDRGDGETGIGLPDRFKVRVLTGHSSSLLTEEWLF